LKVSTSGSTGTPFTILHNINKKNRNTADTIYFAEKVGYNLGAKLFYIRMWNVRLRKNEMISWFQNIVKHSVFDLDAKGIAILLKKIEKHKFTKLNILSYASAYETMVY
jgi:phenylacetate-CoA ligase